MSDSRLSFSKDIATTLGLSEAVLLEVLKKFQIEGKNLEELHSLLPFWNKKELLDHLDSLLSKGLIVKSDETAKSIFSIKKNHSNSREKSSMESAWQPDKELLDQIQEYGIPEEFSYSLVDDFKHLNKEKDEKNKSWGIKFLRFVIKQWRHKEVSDNQKKKRKPIEANWKPEDEAREILVRSGIDNNFIDEEIPEFVLYWSERKEESDIWNSKFISHVRRKWGRHLDVNEKNEIPFKIATNWLPNEDFYDVLSLTNISREFAESTIAEFILYWKETGQSHNSWNSKFLQHVKFQWEKFNQNQSPQVQSNIDKRIQSNWNISKPKSNKRDDLNLEQTKLNFKKLKDKHQI